MVALLVFAAVLQLQEDRRVALEQGDILVGAMVNAIGQHMSGSIRAVDGLLDEAATAVESGRWSTPAFVDHLNSRLRSFPEVRYVAQISADGRMLPGTVPTMDVPAPGLDVSDRDYFTGQPHDAGSPRGLVIGTPVIGRVSSERSLHLSRPVFDAQGKFAGLVIAAVNPDHYAHFLETVLLEEAGASAVIRTDGTILARAPEHVQKFGTRIADSELFTRFLPQAPSGVARLVARADGNDKLVGYQLVENYPLVVTSGLTIRTALHSWRWLAWIEGSLVAAFAAALYYWAGLADLRESRLDDHQRRLADIVTERTGELRKAREMAEQRSHRLSVVNQELRRLAQVTAHHLQEPLRPIVSYTQMTRRKLAGQDDEIDMWLDFVESSGLRLKLLLRDFQRYASILATEPALRKTDVGEAARIALARLRPLVESTRAIIRLDSLPWLIADADLLAGVFLQLFDNALRHRHPARPPEIRVSAVDEGESWRIEVADNASGIEPALFAKAFQAFERLDSHSADSTGLGLAVCRAVIEAHGGRIWIEPLAEGSRLCFSLPKTPPASLLAAATPAPESAAPREEEPV